MQEQPRFRQPEMNNIPLRRGAGDLDLVRGLQPAHVRLLNVYPSPTCSAVLWWIIQAIRVLRQPENWRRHKIIGAAWLIGLAACFAINAYYVYAAEQEMRQVVADIERYHAQHGKYPDKLDDTGTP
ncbi:MAG: hypothetical protein ACFNS8_03675 [Kingella oralis]